ncbi:Cytochrome b-c1 complex subunit 6, mitochondrial [Paraconiothyrium brasiliense]|uniref:Cytochrome b-c1 complex subunit 6, mitochondrial n=1 Tax=Paraconiothyrium brasiliense TaxID=300254 RepID=A0ABR3R3F9_9PLEO
MAPPQGGTSTDTPASGTDEQSDEEAEVNKQDSKEEGEGEQGHKPSGGDEDEEEEEEEEPQDPKDVLEKGESHRTAFLGPPKLSLGKSWSC